MELLTADFLNAFASRLKEATSDCEMTMSEVAQRVGVARSSAFAWYNGTNAPSHVKLLSLAEILKVTPEWLLFGIGQKDGKTETLKVNVFDPSGLDQRGAELFNIGQVATQMEISKDWLISKFGLTADEPLYLLTAQGNSMRPTIEEGDILLVQPFNGRIQNEAVYVTAIQNLVSIKRFQNAPDGSTLITSDNPSFHAFTVKQGDDVKIIGRVLYRWHGDSI